MFANLAALLVAFALAGCGQKGQLYLPSAEPAPVDEAPANASRNQAEPEDSTTQPESQDPIMEEAGKDDR